MYFDKEEIKQTVDSLLSKLTSISDNERNLIILDILNRKPDRCLNNTVSEAMIYDNKGCKDYYNGIMFMQSLSGEKDCMIIGHNTEKHWWTNSYDICLHDSFVGDLYKSICGNVYNQSVTDIALESFLIEYDIELYRTAQVQVLGNRVGIEVATIDKYNGRDIFHYVSFLPYDKFQTEYISAIYKDVISRIAQLKTLDCSDIGSIQRIQQICDATDDECVAWFFKNVIIPNDSYIDIDDKYFYR